MLLCGCSGSVVVLSWVACGCVGEVVLWLCAGGGRAVVWPKWFCGCVVEVGVWLCGRDGRTWVEMSMDEASKKLNTQFPPVTWVEKQP